MPTLACLRGPSAPPGNSIKPSALQVTRMLVPPASVTAWLTTQLAVAPITTVRAAERVDGLLVEHEPARCQEAALGQRPEADKRPLPSC